MNLLLIMYFQADIEMNWAIKAMEHANIHYNVSDNMDMVM